MQDVADEFTDKAIEEAGRNIHEGFVAQEVEEAAKKLGFEFYGVDKPKTIDGLYGLRYDNFVVPLVKAVQELSKQNEELRKQNVEQEKRIDKLESILNVSSNNSAQASTTIALTDASLEQNAPNPFINATTIQYVLPQKFISAQIVFTDYTGKMLRQVNLSGSGKGTIHINTSSLVPGI